MSTVHKVSVSHSAFVLPTLKIVGPVEWVEVQTRLYGIDAAGNVFVFKPPFTVPRHRSNRRPGHFLFRRLRAYRAKARRAARV